MFYTGSDVGRYEALSGVTKAIVEPLAQWYDEGHRDLPWRREAAPYRVWVSEIMLQQTRVEAVRGYYERWMQAFPDVPSLAAADEAQVLKLWEGDSAITAAPATFTGPRSWSANGTAARSRRIMRRFLRCRASENIPQARSRPSASVCASRR